MVPLPAFPRQELVAVAPELVQKDGDTVTRSAFAHPNLKTAVDQLPMTQPQDAARVFIPNRDQIIGKGLERTTVNREEVQPVFDEVAAGQPHFRLAVYPAYLRDSQKCVFLLMPSGWRLPRMKPANGTAFAGVPGSGVHQWNQRRSTPSLAR